MLNRCTTKTTSVTNLTSPYILFAHYILVYSSNSALSFLSLHTVGQLATIPCVINLQSPVIWLCKQWSIVSEGKVQWSYIHEGDRMTRCRHGHSKFSKNWPSLISHLVKIGRYYFSPQLQVFCPCQCQKWIFIAHSRSKPLIRWTHLHCGNKNVFSDCL